MGRALLVLAAAFAGCSDGAGGGDAGADAGVFSSAVAAAACVTAESCGLDQSGVSRCTLTVAGVNLAANARAASIDAPAVSCLAAARADCGAARRCLNGGKMPQPCTLFEARACAGSVLTTCTNATGTMGSLATASFDCASGGETCVAIVDGGVGCGAAACAPGTAARCRGDAIETCDDGVAHDFDCAPLGAACVDVGGPPRCRGRGAACSGSTLNTGQPLRCDGSVLVSCWDGQEGRFDCALAGADCFPTVGTGSFGCALGNQCDAAAFSSTCSGNTLRFCDHGKLATVDCLAAGFTTCDAFGGRCVP
jgi:hypothetical protein